MLTTAIIVLGLFGAFGWVLAVMKTRELARAWECYDERREEWGDARDKAAELQYKLEKVLSIIKKD